MMASRIVMAFILGISVPIQSQTTPDPNTMVGCSTDRSCGGISVPSTMKDCCDHDIEPFGFAYTIPVEGCNLCPVDFGFNQSSFSGIEQGESYKVQVKFFSGEITTGFLFTLSLDLSNGTASNSDITLVTTRSRFLASDFLQSKDIEFSLNVDNIAQESNETFVLTLQLTSNDQFAGANVTIRDRLKVVIIDSDEITFQLSEADYTQNEEPDALMEVSITKGSGIQLANPVYFRVTPLTVDDALARGVISEFEAENPFSPNRANYEDFNQSVLYVEFPTDRDSVEVAIPIVDDDIDEADEQVFIIFLEVINATDLNNLNILENRKISVGRIRDDEVIRIGFEHQSYEVTEPNPDDENVISNLVYLIREDNRKSEKTYSVDLTVGDPGENFKPATIETFDINENFDYSFGSLGQTKQNVLFPPTVNRIAFVFSLNPDLAVEGTETFRATSAQVTPSGNFSVFQTPTGVTAFATALIHILDNDGELIVGFEELNYTISESAGTVEVCVGVISPPPTVDLDVTIALSPSTINGTAEAGSDFTLLTAFLSTLLTFPSSHGSPTAGLRRECFDVTITDDDLFENNESFFLLLQEDIFSSQTGAIIHPDRTDIIILDDDGCPNETDPWNIIWPNTSPDTKSIQRCPGGNAIRYCDGNKVWSRTNALSCASAEFVNLLEEAREAFLSNDLKVLLNISTYVTSQLANMTTGRELPLFPMDLQITNSLIHSVINMLEDNADVLQQSSATKPDVDDVISVFNNVLDENNTAGWLNLRNLLQVETMNGSELLLSNAERYGLMIAKKVEPPRRLSRPNIVLSASQFNVSSLTDEDLSFSIGEDLAIHTSRIIPILATIPADLIREKLITSSSVPVVHILFNNLEDFLPLLDSSGSPKKTSVIYSLQISERKDHSRVLLEEPISLEFAFSSNENDSNYTCAFWDFSKPIGSGGFSTNGVTTANIARGENITSVQCLSNHATSFAVLVDVAGGLETVSEGELKALQVVSYFGCSVSILCLSLTVLFFLTQRKKIFKSVNFFVHLNLASTLLAAFIVFVFGIELGKTTTGGCLFVALLLHYLFLSAFCWMLCEGILLYLLLVVVFSRLSRQWWLFILIGYVSPIPIVVISVASRHDYYGVRSSDGVLKYCWLSGEKGTIYAFVAPMLVIILINVVFLVLSLNSLAKSKIKRYSKKADKKANFTMAKSLFIASIILLPLLGLTWTFGILTINSDSTVFAWFFTIFNSLQGAAIFFFHVVRNETVWSKIQPRLSILSIKILGTKEGDTKLHTSENSSWSTKSRYTSSSIYSKGLKVKPTDLTTSEGFNNSLVLEETKINLEKMPDNDKVKDEDINIEECEEQAKESAEKETSIIYHHKDVNPASEDTIVKEMAANGSQEDFEGDNKVLSKRSNNEAVDNMSMEGSSAIDPAVSDHKDINLNREDNEAEETKREQLESKVESMDDNAEVIESNGSSALY